MECSSTTASQRRCGRREKKQQRRQTNDATVRPSRLNPSCHCCTRSTTRESQKDLHVEFGHPRRARPALLSRARVHSKGSTRRIGCMQDTPINVTFARGSSSIPAGFGAKVYLEPAAYFSLLLSFQRLSSLFPHLSLCHVFCRERLSHNRNCWYGWHGWASWDCWF